MSCCCKEKNKTDAFRTGGLVPWDQIYGSFGVNTEPSPYPETCMRGNTLECWFIGCIPERHIEHRLYQYDKGIVLNIHGLDTELVNGIEFYLDGVKTEGTLTVVDPLAEAEEEHGAEEPSAEEPEEIALEDKPYFAVELPDEMFESAGTVTAYLTYAGEEPKEYRTVKTLYFEIMPRLSPVDAEEDSEQTTEEQLAEIEQEINALCQRLCALRSQLSA